MKPAICVLFLVIWMTHEQFGWCKSQKFFPNGRYGRSDPSMPPLADYENNMENLIDDPNGNQANDNKQLEKESSFNHKQLISRLLNNRDLTSKDKFKPLFTASTDRFLFCLITNRSQLGGEPLRLVCKTER